MAAAGTDKEVAGGVMALQTRGVDGGFRLLPDQAARLSARGGLEEEQAEAPFFKSRPAA